MNSDGKFFTAVWAFASLMVIVLILSILSASHETKRTMASMVEAGSHPIAAKCALDVGVEGDRHMCMKYIESME